MTSDKRVTGRIAERIVANELEAHGFIVRDLNREGIAANSDLIAYKDGTTWYVQVKGCRYDREWFFHYGACGSDQIEKVQPMFNRITNVFYADVVVLVCFRNPYDYQCVILPVSVAEKVAQLNLDYQFRTPKKDGTKRSGSVVYTNIDISDKWKSEPHLQEIEILKKHFVYREDGSQNWFLAPEWGSTSPNMK